jgi:hypothetical protein
MMKRVLKKQGNRIWTGFLLLRTQANDVLSQRRGCLFRFLTRWTSIAKDSPRTGAFVCCIIDFTASVSWLRERTILTERPPLVGEASANFADRKCHVFSVTDPSGCILGFLGWSHYFLFQIAPQLCWWGWVDPVPDRLLLRKSGNRVNWTQTFGSPARNSEH